MICPEHGIEHYHGDPGPHEHETIEPCRACFRDYIERNHGLPTAPMDFDDLEEAQKANEMATGIYDTNPSLTALIRDKS